MITPLTSPDRSPGFIARDEAGIPQGLITYSIENRECEIESFLPAEDGWGLELVKAVRIAADQASCWRLWTVIGRAHIQAIGLFQKAGFQMAALRRGNKVEFEHILRELPPPPEAPPFPLRLSRRTVYESDWISLHLDRVVFPDGKLIPEYHMVHTRNAVAVLVENEAGELLFEHSYRYATGRMEWEIPAGGIEEGEEILETARREVFEETGCVTHDHCLIYAYNPANGNIDTRFYIVACRAGIVQGGIDRGEIESFRWMSRAEIEALIRQGELQDGFTLSAVLLNWWMKEK
jgi:ADP-ribose pyrophosphatase